MSTTDNRTPHTDALDTLGRLLDDTAKRDAIHLAVYPVVAGEHITAGDHVRLGPDGKAYIAHTYREAIGIADPFIVETTWPGTKPSRSVIAYGSRFWLVVLPRTITSLRHVWEHPAFPASGECDVAPVAATPTAEPASATAEAVAASEQWLRDFCDNADCPGYDAVMDVILKGEWRDENHSDDAYYSGGVHGEIEWGRHPLRGPRRTRRYSGRVLATYGYRPWL